MCQLQEEHFQEILGLYQPPTSIVTLTSSFSSLIASNLSPTQSTATDIKDNADQLNLQTIGIEYLFHVSNNSSLARQALTR